MNLFNAQFESAKLKIKKYYLYRSKSLITNCPYMFVKLIEGTKKWKTGFQVSLVTKSALKQAKKKLPF